MLRFAYLACGVVSLGLAFLGTTLPVLPTTPFVLLAAFCFARGNPAWHERLRNSRAFGPMVRDWEEHGAISPRAKRLATAAMTVVAGWLWAFGTQPSTFKVLVTVVEAAVLVFIWTRPSDGSRKRRAPVAVQRI